MYSSIDNVNGQIIGVYTGYTITSNNRSDAFNKGINTEHVWPQGLFDKDEPMRGDIHHLFPTRIEANSAVLIILLTKYPTVKPINGLFIKRIK